MRKWQLTLSFFLLCLSSVFLQAKDLNFESLKQIPVQDGGRVKPFDTFAKESLRLIYGKQKMAEKEAVEIVLTWMLLPDYWAKMEILKIDYPRVKKDLELPEGKKYFSPAEIMSHPRLPALLQEVSTKQADQERLSSYDVALQTLSNQLALFQSIGQGLNPGFFPPDEGDKWRSPSQFLPKEQEKFSQIATAFVGLIKEDAKPSSSEDLAKAVKEFLTENKGYDKAHIEREIHYNDLHPFLWSWVFYLLSAIAIFALWLSGNQNFYRVAVALVVVGFAFHSYGFLLRILLTGRPPVSNMYETVIWVPWGAVVFALIFEWVKKSRYMLLAANIVATLCLIVADNAPNVLDASLQPLEPVLDSNLWLTVHVLTITLSYGAFFLAFILADIALIFILKNEEKFRSEVRDLGQAVYRAEKVGVVLLAAGTILGGVWADYSWGRFWGWDPKETWALIALLGYLALLHAKAGGYIRQVGMLAGSVVAFSLVVMAWYGVNFVLGAGLHSYGFGAGGIEFVAGFVGLHFVFVAFVLAARRSSKN